MDAELVPEQSMQAPAGETVIPAGETVIPVDKTKAPPVWMFALLVLPYAVFSNGFVNTVVAVLLRAEQVPLDRIANVNALLLAPAMLYCLWSPLVDFWLRRRTWVAIASGIAGLLLGLALQFRSLAAAGPKFLLVLAMAVVMLTSSGVGGLMAAVVPPELKTRASSFFNAGSLGFGALAGGGLLYLSQHLSRKPFGWACGLLVAMPGLLALTVAEPAVVGHGDAFGAVIGRMGREFRQTFFKWSAVPVLLMLCSPLGSGAALSLLPGLAPDYGISINQVAWLNGVAGGLLTALGALMVGFLKLPDDLRPVYALAGLVNAGTLGILCLGHPRPVTYYAAATLFMLTVGGCYALFTALALQLLGISGKSGSSRYAIALSLGNAPVFYMTLVDGQGARLFGVKGLPGADMVVSGGVALAFLAWFWWERQRGIKPHFGVDAVD